MMEINDLPGEMMIKVFRQLPTKDLKMALLVSKKWRAIGEDPSLWKCGEVGVNDREDINRISIRRLRDVQKIIIDPSTNWQDGDLDALFQVLMEFPKLKILEGLSGVNLSSVEPETLANVVAKLEEVWMVNTTITNDQVLAIFSAMSLNCHLRTRLQLSGNNLSSVDPELFARVLEKLELVWISNTSITNDQAQAIFTAMSLNCHLTRLNLDSNDLSSVEPELFATVLTKLELASLQNTNITNDQAQAIFTALSLNCQLNRLVFAGNDLSSVEPELLTWVITKLEVACLRNANITTDQAQAIFTAIALNCQLTRLYLDNNDLSAVEPELFATAVTKLELASLKNTNITNVQAQAIFTAMSLSCHLKILQIASNNLSSVDPELFARAITNLEMANFNDTNTNIHNDQAHAIFTAISLSCHLKTLQIAGINLSSVEPELFARAITKLEMANLNTTNITNDQIQALFRALHQNCQLMQLELAGNNLSSVEPELLATVVTKLNMENLNYTNITNDQAQAIFTAISLNCQLKELSLYGNNLSSVEPGLIAKVAAKLKVVY